MEVHRELGPGLRELPYENALRNELRYRKYRVDQQRAWPIHYKSEIVGDCFTDLFVSNDLVVEIKAIAVLGDEELSQVLNYLRISKMRVGLLLNFKPKSLEIKRVSL
ncbi:MAG: GxxExxY protein [Akkermansiaceae bacterium]|nr:GxxExxY protein [Akkermansiaceae bacterium]